MNKLLLPVSDAQFKDNVSIRFKNILDGFDNFYSFSLCAQNLNDGEKSFINFICKVFQENDNEAYVDLFFNKLTNEDKNNLLNLIYPEDEDILKSHLNLNHNGSYYKLTCKELIPFLVRLNTREIFFVTFYFTKKPLTIWGNYNLQFPCFCNNKDILEFYHNLSLNYF